MAKFRVGDKVRATHSFADIFERYIYTVTRTDGLYVGLEGKPSLYDIHGFELYEEPLPVWVNTPEPDERLHPHYYKDFGAYLDQETGRVLVDVYAVLDEFEVKEPELQHLAKKVLCLGMRGHKLADEDLDNIIDTAKRLKERRQLKEEYNK